VKRTDGRKDDGSVMKKFTTKEEANKYVKYYWRDTEAIDRDYWEDYKLQIDGNGFLRVCTVDQEGEPSKIWAEEVGKKIGWTDIEESDELDKSVAEVEEKEKNKNKKYKK